MKAAVLFTGILLAQISWAQEPSDSEAAPNFPEAQVTFPTKDELAAKPLYWMCRASTTVRTLKVEYKNGACKTIYNKDGVDRDSGQAKEVAHCYAVFKNIKKNLESNLWTCKDISNTNVVTNE